MSRRNGGTAGRRDRWDRVLAVVRRVAGMPDYEAHLDHLRRCHPERPAPTRREFFEQYLRTRYGDGPTRCC